MAQIKTRKKTNCPIFGTPKELWPNKLPTYHDVMKYYLFIKQEFKPERTSKEPTVLEISERVAIEIRQIWEKASIPVIIHKRVLQMIRAYHDKYRNLTKPYKKRQGSENYKNKIRIFQENSRRLFDICSCKCKNIGNSMCTCEKNRRVPKRETAFLIDQRTERKMIIGSIDLVTTKRESDRIERKERDLSLAQRDVVFQQPSCSHGLTSVRNRITNVSDSIDLELTHISRSGPPEKALTLQDDILEPPSKQMRVNLSSLALACDRTGVSDRSAAITASTVLQDFGVVTSDDKSFVVDRSKVRRERTKMRSELKQDEGTEPILGLYFDGRRDKTMPVEKKGSKYYRKIQIEEHYVLVSEPGDNYFGHVTCQSGSAQNIKTAIINYLNSNSVDVSFLSVVGCDGTAVNTGPKGGVIRLLEHNLNRPLQRLVCQLHANELPLRHLMLHLGGQTSGPRCFSGQIGTELQRCEKLPTVEFEIISTTLPRITNQNLSTI